MTTPDDLILQVGEYLLSHPPTDDATWASLALVVAFEASARSLHGYVYDSSSKSEPASAEDFALVDMVDGLRTAMHEPGKPDWHCCLIQIVRATRRMVVTFEYDNPERWHITPRNLLTMREGLRPPTDL